jgi:hypothetical protein
VRTGLRHVTILALAVSATAALSAQEGSATAAVDRVRAKLEKPPSKLTLQERPADFTVHIEKRRPMQDIFDVPAWATDPIGWQPPRIGFDVLGLLRSIKRGHDERGARQDVATAVTAYCNAQSNFGAGIHICDARK